jgi:CheY-like chemotaxis protein
MTFENVDFDLREVVANAVALLAPRAKSQNSVLNYSVDKNIGQKVTGDPSRLRQILLNLLSNAVKFTEKGEVSLSVARSSETDEEVSLLFSVRDSGIGIADDVQKSLFQSFTQADASTTRKFGGTGLGLAICRKLVELMGGSIGVNSVLGQGSTFWFTLQLAKPGAFVLPVNGVGTAPNPSYGVHAGAPAVVARNTRIILAEDNKVNQLVALRQLKKLGYENVRAVDTGVETLRLWSQDGAGIILMDCQMPNLNGYEATQKIRELELEAKTPRTWIIAMTANIMEGNRELCLAAGMDDYLSKPVDMVELKNALEKAVVESDRQSEVKAVEAYSTT